MDEAHGRGGGDDEPGLKMGMSAASQVSRTSGVSTYPAHARNAQHASNKQFATITVLLPSAHCCAPSCTTGHPSPSRNRTVYP